MPNPKPSPEDLAAEADRIARGEYYGGPNHVEPYDGDQAAEDADYEANARYDYVREAYGAEAFNEGEAALAEYDE